MTAAIKIPKRRSVYVIYNEERNRSKIGMSVDPTQRLQNLQTGNDAALSLPYYLEMDAELAPRVEKRARRIGEEAGKNRTREWLANTSPSEAQSYVQRAYEIERGRNRS